MKNILFLMTVLLSCAWAIMAHAATPNLQIGPSGACIVDSSLNRQRFYYCGRQDKDCAGEKHNDKDYYVCNNGTEQTSECFITDGTKFTTKTGAQYYCCGGTSSGMGYIQSAPCADGGQSAGDIPGMTLGPSKGCMVNNSPIELFYCGEQDKGCAGVADNSTRPDWTYYHGESFFRHGNTFYCHNGTKDKMGEFKLEPPNVTVVDEEQLGPSGACIVSSKLNRQRFYYCGHQATGCAGEKHNDKDYYVCNDGTEQEEECFITHNNRFTTVAGRQYYCCGGTSSGMGTIQNAPCKTASSGAASSGVAQAQSAPADGSVSSGTNGSSSPNATDEPVIIYQDCPPGIRHGNNPTTGACIECPTGKYYNAKDKINGYCSWTTVLSKTDMMYGQGQTQNSNTRLRDQCWTIKDPIAYRACVLNGGKKPQLVQKVPSASVSYGATYVAPANTVMVK